jgi:hypothetical protein
MFVAVESTVLTTSAPTFVSGEKMEHEKPMTIHAEKRAEIQNRFLFIRFAVKSYGKPMEESSEIGFAYKK